MREIILPAGAPAQVKSWLIDYNRLIKAPQTNRLKLEEVKAKLDKYLNAVKANGGKAIQPPRTQVEEDLATGSIRKHGYTHLKYRSNY